jgi:hypothetical protein
MPNPVNILVVANRTACSDSLVGLMRERADRAPSAFSLVVPATPHGLAWATDMDSGHEAAQAAMEAAAARYRSAGLSVKEARVGHPDPVAAVLDAVHFAPFNEVIVSTLPHHLSDWLKLSLHHRVRRATGLAVAHVEDIRAPVAA